MGKELGVRCTYEKLGSKFCKIDLVLGLESEGWCLVLVARWLPLRCKLEDGGGLRLHLGQLLNVLQLLLLVRGDRIERVLLGEGLVGWWNLWPLDGLVCHHILVLQILCLSVALLH